MGTGNAKEILPLLLATELELRLSKRLHYELDDTGRSYQGQVENLQELRDWHTAGSAAVRQRSTTILGSDYIASWTAVLHEASRWRREAAASDVARFESYISDTTDELRGINRELLSDWIVLEDLAAARAETDKALRTYDRIEKIGEVAEFMTMVLGLRIAPSQLAIKIEMLKWRAGKADRTSEAVKKGLKVVGDIYGPTLVLAGSGMSGHGHSSFADLRAHIEDLLAERSGLIEALEVFEAQRSEFQGLRELSSYPYYNFPVESVDGVDTDGDGVLDTMLPTEEDDGVRNIDSDGGNELDTTRPAEEPEGAALESEAAVDTDGDGLADTTLPAYELEDLSEPVSTRLGMKQDTDGDRLVVTTSSAYELEDLSEPVHIGKSAVDDHSEGRTDYTVPAEELDDLYVPVQAAAHGQIEDTDDSGPRSAATDWVDGEESAPEDGKVHPEDVDIDLHSSEAAAGPTGLAHVKADWDSDPGHDAVDHLHSSEATAGSTGLADVEADWDSDLGHDAVDHQAWSSHGHVDFGDWDGAEDESDVELGTHGIGSGPDAHSAHDFAAEDHAVQEAAHAHAEAAEHAAEAAMAEAMADSDGPIGPVD